MTEDRNKTPGHAPSGDANSVGDMWRDLGSSWQSSAEAMMAWGDAWRSMLTTRGAPVGATMLRTMMDPREWPTALVPILDEIRTALTLPKLADFPAFDMSVLPSPIPLMTLLKLCQDNAAIGIPVWIEAGKRFQAEVATRRSSDGGDLSAGDLLDVWNNILDRTLMEFNRSGDFAAAQKRFLQAAVQQRRDLQRSVENAAKIIDMPTRSEMKDVYRRMHELMREVSKLRREVRMLRSGKSTNGKTISVDARHNDTGVDEPPGKQGQTAQEARDALHEHYPAGDRVSDGRGTELREP